MASADYPNTVCGNGCCSQPYIKPKPIRSQMAILLPNLIFTFHSSKIGKAAPMTSVKIEKTVPTVRLPRSVLVS